MELVKDTTALIIQKHLEFELSLKTSVNLAIEIGRLLAEKKEELGHGEFTPWVNENLPFTTRTAQNYMRLFNKREAIEEAKPKDITEAYLMIKPEKPKPKPYVIEDDDEVIVDDKPKVSKSNGGKTVYEYWDHLEPLIDNMLKVHHRLASLRNSTTPIGLGNMIGNIKDMAIVLQTWDPAIIGRCSVCLGKGCSYCIDGKSGISKESEY